MRYQIVMRCTSILILLLGLSALTGWAAHLSTLISMVPGYPSMKFNTALCFLAFGSMLFLLATGKQPVLFYSFTFLTLLFSIVSLSEYIFRYNAGIDEFFVRDRYHALLGNVYPGRMSPSTALSFLLLSVAFPLVRNGPAARTGQYLLHFVAVVSFVAIVGYLFAVPVFHKLGFLSSMALPTAAGLLVLSIAASLRNPNIGLTALFAGDKIGNGLARKLFPAIVLIELLLGFIRIESHRLKWISDESGIALSTTAFILLNLVFFWSAAEKLNKTDESRTTAERKLQQTNDDLENLVNAKMAGLRAIFNSSLVSIIETDSMGLITHFNKGAEQMLGYKADELIHRHTVQILHVPEEEKAMSAELNRLFQRKISGVAVFTEMARTGRSETREWLYRRKDGSTFPVQLAVTPIIDESGGIRGYLGIAADISDLKSAHIELTTLAARLQRQNLQLLNFAQITSHNLRGPVANLNALASFYDVQMSMSEKDNLFNKFSIVIHQLSTTLNDLVAALKIQEDRNIAQEQLSFGDIFEKVKDTLAEPIRTASARITQDFSRAETIHYPRAYLENIMLNLLSNAIRYRSPLRPPEIHVDTANDNGEIRLTFADNGLGIDLRKNRDRLFGLRKVFHRHADANGVGLFITKTQVEAMGGALLVESEVDRGTRFCIVFNPLKQAT